MIIILFAIVFHSLVSHNVEALPILTQTGQDPVARDVRTRSDIIWSCLAVMFSFAWVAVHSDVPPSGSAWHSRGDFLRFMMSVLSILVPEYLLVRHYTDKYQDYKWTLTHGFFAVMGGFVLELEGKNQSLGADSLEEHLAS